MQEKRSGVFTNLYGLVKAFWKDFYHVSKRGTAEHKKGIVIFFSFVFLCLVVFVVGMYKFSESPFFCGLCHNMKVYVDSWKASTHRQVDCIKCHYKPGLVNHLKGKWKDGQLSLAYFITGKGPTKPHAEIDDASCLQSGCHKRSDLKNDMVFKNVLFSHPRHIEQMRREKQLRCATCHSQIVQGAHMTVTDVECFICHFYKGKEQKAFVTGCPTCHFEARGDIKVNENFVFNHKTYIDRGIKCEQCHTNVTSGDGRIPDFACLQCHNKREILEAKYTPEFLHRNHVTNHKVECFTCHSPIKHQVTGLHYSGQEAEPCADCHANALHLAKVDMYLGKGAKFAAGRPNRMAMINMDCNVCHDPGRTAGASCKECHGDLTEGMVQRWKKLLKDGQEQLQKAISAAKAAAGDNPSAAAKQALKDAQYNYEFVRKGNGVHNIVYALQIIEASEKALQTSTKGKAKAQDEKAEKGKKAAAVKIGTGGKSEVSCMKLCHGQIPDKKVRFGSVNFPHAAHMDGEDSCLKCHSPYVTHGKTILKDCSSCHHGEGAGKVKCSDCHRAEEAMFEGRGIKGILESPPDSMYGKVTCTECHTAVKRGKKSDIADVKASCVRCHGKQYAHLVDEWLATNKKLQEKYNTSIVGLEKEITALEEKEGRHSVPLRGFYNEVNLDMQFALKGRWQHNPIYGEAIMKKVDKNAEALQNMINTRKAGRPIIIKK